MAKQKHQEIFPLIFGQGLTLKDCLPANGYSNYNMTYGQFMKDVYIPAYDIT